MVDDATARRRERVRWFQHYLLNPPVTAAVWTGLVPGLVLVETTGRRSGKRRRNVVGMKLDGDTGWVVAEHGRHAGYVNNLEAQPDVRVRIRGRWHAARAHIEDDDDAEARLDSFGRRSHEAAVRRFGTALLSIRFELRPD